MTVNVTVTDPFNTTSTTFWRHACTESDSGNSGLIVTLNSTTSNTGNTVYNYTITKPKHNASRISRYHMDEQRSLCYGAGVASLTVA